MVDKITINDIYDKNLNFLIGAGASFGLFPTLSVSIKGDDDSSQTIETLSTIFEKSQNDDCKALLFMYYFEQCIDPVLKLDFDAVEGETAKDVVTNYKKVIKSILFILKLAGNLS